MSLIIICAIFSIYLINPVSAEETSGTGENLGCCERTNSGESCRYTNVEDCVSTPPFNVGSFQRCEDSAFCKPGCCISPDGGCSRQVSKGTCKSAGDGYTWNQDATCNIEKCQKGCCVLGGVECKYTTAKRCSGITANFEGLSLDFRNAVGSEQECTNICKQQDDGCCVKATGECTRTTREMCGLSDGTGSDGFYKDALCSNPNLQNACDPKCREKARMGCVEGLEDVYYFDSCGNREGVVTEPITGGDAPNGDCDYARGTLCSGADKNHPTAYCKSVNCKGAELSNYEQINYDDGVNRYNGESWCIYDSKPGPALDTVGSRHWRHICINGEEIVEPCKDFREEYCMQMDVKGVDPYDYSYRESGCIKNDAITCTMDCNTAKEAAREYEIIAKTRSDKSCCESSSRDCVWQWVNAEETKGTCLPRVTPGIAFWGDEEGNVNQNARAICNKKSIEEYQTYWQENVFDNFNWECTDKCEAYSDSYLKTNNLYCTSAGDCGAKYNYRGSWNNEAYFRGWEGDSQSSSDKHYMSDTDLPESYTYNYLTQKENIGNGIYGGEIESTGEVPSALMFIYGVGSDLPGTLATAKAVGWVAVSITATIVVVAVIATYVIAESLGIVVGMSAVFGPAGWIVGAIMAAIAIILLALTYSGDSEKRNVFTNCEPWIAPVGGEDCEKCDEVDEKTGKNLHPCSEYRCRSLGQQCKFIAENEGTTKGSCYNEDPNDVTKPQIKPWFGEGGNYPLAVWKRERTSEGPQRVEVHSEYQINVLPSSTKYNSGYEITAKLPSFSTIEFGIKTDNKPSQCKYSTEYSPDMTFATAGNWFDDNYYSKEHNKTIFGLLPNKTYTYYIICRGANGYPKEDERTPPFKITFETGEGPDLEPPFIVGSYPQNNGYVKAEEDLKPLFYIDEVSPFKCKMAKADMDYSLMDMNLSCINDAAEGFMSGYSLCAANLTLHQGVNTYYIRCRDEPITGTPANTMEESYVYSVIQSEPLLINNVLPPSGTTYYTRNVTMQVVTEKGAFSGKAICSYEETTTRLISGEFFQTDSAQHLQEFSGLPTRAYNFQIDCFDSVGNEASAATNFSVEADTIPPNVIALYKVASGLHLTLDEKASCEYSNTKFSYGTGTSASTDSETAVFPATMKQYYIICKDKFGNTMPEIMVKTEI
ncbi:MAG: hypothetical protein QME12_02505 [Nanoarchaeota archaeon]|nr:hypothetical protein [Nanoarchaeota archaeon]